LVIIGTDSNQAVSSNGAEIELTRGGGIASFKGIAFQFIVELQRPAAALSVLSANTASSHIQPYTQ
jgi:hypothetical protein